MIRSLPKQLRIFLFDRGGLIVLAVLALYMWVAPQNIVFGDNAEMSGLASVGGIAHPPGYPLYILWLRAWSWLPEKNPAHAAAIATTILAAMQMLVLHAACRAWGARAFAASVAVAVYSAGPIVMRIHTEAEVFALNGLVVATLLWLSAKTGPLRGMRRVFALGLVAGFGLSNHLTCVLVAPVGVVGVVRGIIESRRAFVAALPIALLGLVAGLTPYVYLFIAPDSWMSWGPITDARGLLHHFLRDEYGGPGAFALRGGAVSMADSVAALAWTCGRSFLWIGAVLGIGGLVRFVVRPDQSESRLMWGMLLVSFVLAGPALVCRFNIEPEGIGRYIVQRFHLLPVLLLVIPVAVTVDRLASRLESFVSEAVRGSRTIHVLLLLCGFAAVATPSLPYVARMHSPAVETALRNMLSTLPPNAIVIGSPDELHFGMAYLQGVRGERRDVSVINVSLVLRAHYRQQVEKRTGIVIVPARDGRKPSVQIAAQALATGRPVFIDPVEANIAAEYSTYPYGLLFRVLPSGAPPPSIRDVFAINKELYGRYTFGYPTPGPDDELAAQYHVLYARAWSLLIKPLEAAGLNEERAFAIAMVAELMPRRE